MGLVKLVSIKQKEQLSSRPHKHVEGAALLHSTAGRAFRLCRTLYGTALGYGQNPTIPGPSAYGSVRVDAIHTGRRPELGEPSRPLLLMHLSPLTHHQPSRRSLLLSTPSASVTTLSQLLAGLSPPLMYLPKCSPEAAFKTADLSSTLGLNRFPWK